MFLQQGFQYNQTFNFLKGHLLWQCYFMKNLYEPSFKDFLVVVGVALLLTALAYIVHRLN